MNYDVATCGCGRLANVSPAQKLNIDFLILSIDYYCCLINFFNNIFLG